MKKLDKELCKILLVVALGCVVMAAIDAVVRPGYAVKSGIKIIFFLLLPLVCFRKTKSRQMLKLVLLSKKGLLKSLFLGIVVYSVILGAYLVIRNFYDFSVINGLLMNNVGVSRENFVFVAVYISFCNSLLEEFFFRGIAFLAIIPYLGRKWAYIFSSFLFAVYHVAIMQGWFSPLLFFIAMAGLMVGGCIFNYLDEKNENIYNSWMVHMFANFAINTVGFILFGMLG